MTPEKKKIHSFVLTYYTSYTVNKGDTQNSSRKYHKTHRETVEQAATPQVHTLALTQAKVADSIASPFSSLATGNKRRLYIKAKTKNDADRLRRSSTQIAYARTGFGGDKLRFGTLFPVDGRLLLLVLLLPSRHTRAQRGAFVWSRESETTTTVDQFTYTMPARRGVHHRLPSLSFSWRA